MQSVGMAWKGHGQGVGVVRMVNGNGAKAWVAALAGGWIWCRVESGRSTGMVRVWVLRG